MLASVNVRFASWCKVTVLTLASFALTDLCVGSAVANPKHPVPASPAKASGPPVNLVPWAASVERRALIDQIHEREQREDLSSLPQPARSQVPVMGPDVKPGRQGLNQNGRERVNFGHIDSPLGPLSLVSREVDQSGRIRGVDFLAFDDPNSKWDMSLKVRHGAMFKLTRKWDFAGERPFAATDKSSYMPSEH